MTEHIWTFPARIVRVVDGDTFDVRCDLGFRNYSHQRVRLRGVDTAEVYGVNHDSEEYARGSMHSQFVRDWASEVGDREWPFTLVTSKEAGKYGRWIGDLYHREFDEWLSDVLIEEFPEVEDA